MLGRQVNKHTALVGIYKMRVSKVRVGQALLASRVFMAETVRRQRWNDRLADFLR